MTDEELIARLLDWEEYDVGDINDAREAAANRIKELKAELAGGSFYQEKDIDALQDRIAAQAAEIERLNTQCEGLFQAAMNNGQALIIAEAKLAKAVEALEKLACKCPSNCDWEHNDICPSWTARTTLTELTGKNHDPV